MALYRICGHAFDSNIAIPELNLAAENQSLFSFQLCTGSRDLSAPCHWLNHWELPDGEIWLAFAKLETDYLLQFPGLADFVVANDAHTVCCYPHPTVPLATVRHLLLNQVIPLVFSHLGKTILHASACATPQGIMAFMGMTGAGKSTMAASFGLRGLPVLTDDCLLVEEQDGVIKGVSSYPGSRLWPESIDALFAEKPALDSLAHYTEKRRFLFDQKVFELATHEQWLELRAVYLLTQPEEPEETEAEEQTSEDAAVIITPVTAQEALLEIIKHTFQLDHTDRRAWVVLSGSTGGWQNLSLFSRLSFARDFAFLSSVNDAILNHFERI